MKINDLQLELRIEEAIERRIGHTTFRGEWLRFAIALRKLGREFLATSPLPLRSVPPARRRKPHG